MEGGGDAGAAISQATNEKAGGRGRSSRFPSGREEGREQVQSPHTTLVLDLCFAGVAGTTNEVLRMHTRLV